MNLLLQKLKGIHTKRLPNGQKGADPLVLKRSLIVCMLMRK